MHTVDEILRASAAWVWYPRGCEHEEEHLQLVRYPARLGGKVQASMVDSVLRPSDVIDYAIARARAWGEHELTFWTGAADAPSLEEELLRRGAVHDDTVTVFARATDAEMPAFPVGVTTEIVRTADQIREVDGINAEVWEQDPLDEDGLAEELTEIAAGLRGGKGARVLARVGGRAASTGGCTLVGGFVRLWGGATRSSARGRGAYRAVIAERLRFGLSHGAATAIVKGRVTTSAPILARAGFEPYGEDRKYLLRF